MRKKILAALVGVPAVLALAATGSATANAGSAPTSTNAEASSFTAMLNPVPGNHVDASGWAHVSLNGDWATVTIKVRGLIMAPHAMHIHFKGEGECPTLPDATMHNGHRAMSTTDGLADYGPIGTSLTTRGDTSPASALAITRFPQVGTYTYVRTIKLSDAVAHAVRTNNAVIVVHGIDYNHNNKYDSVLGVSDLTNTLPMEATSPAICGPLS